MKISVNQKYKHYLHPEKIVKILDQDYNSSHENSSEFRATHLIHDRTDYYTIILFLKERT
jgi:hypothetical protein